MANFFRVICKALLDRESTGELRARYVRTAQALYELRPVELESTLARVVESRIGTFNDDASLFVLISGLCRVSCGWNQLNEGIRARVVLLLKNASVKELVRDHELFGPLPKPPIDDVVLERLQEVLLSDTYSADFIEQVEVEPDVRILEAVKSYVRDASDYFLAQAALRGAISMIPIMTPADLAVILERAAKNDQVTGSVLVNRQLSVLRRQTTALGEDFAAEWDKYDAMLVEL